VGEGAHRLALDQARIHCKAERAVQETESVLVPISRRCSHPQHRRRVDQRAPLDGGVLAGVKERLDAAVEHVERVAGGRRAAAIRSTSSRSTSSYTARKTSSLPSKCALLWSVERPRRRIRGLPAPVAAGLPS
jgi:hypothetical protein